MQSARKLLESHVSAAGHSVRIDQLLEPHQQHDDVEQMNLLVVAAAATVGDI